MDSENEVIDNIATTENVANMNSLNNNEDNDLEVIYLDKRDEDENNEYNEMNVHSNIESYEPYIPDENEIYENTNSPAFEMPNTIDDQEERQERQERQNVNPDNNQIGNQEENTNLTSMDDLLTNKGANLQVKRCNRIKYFLLETFIIYKKLN